VDAELATLAKDGDARKEYYAQWDVQRKYAFWQADDEPPAAPAGAKARRPRAGGPPRRPPGARSAGAPACSVCFRAVLRAAPDALKGSRACAGHPAACPARARMQHSVSTMSAWPSAALEVTSFRLVPRESARA